MFLLSQEIHIQLFILFYIVLAMPMNYMLASDYDNMHLSQIISQIWRQKHRIKSTWLRCGGLQVLIQLGPQQEILQKTSTDHLADQKMYSEKSTIVICLDSSLKQINNIRVIFRLIQVFETTALFYLPIYSIFLWLLLPDLIGSLMRLL